MYICSTANLEARLYRARTQTRIRNKRKTRPLSARIAVLIESGFSRGKPQYLFIDIAKKTTFCVLLMVFVKINHLSKWLKRNLWRFASRLTVYNLKVVQPQYLLFRIALLAGGGVINLQQASQEKCRNSPHFGHFRLKNI